MITTRRPRTQAERSAETQVALLEATVASLVELGYARTSTTEIVRRAGVSRGAQVHHYPTKGDLVVAAVEHVFERQERAFVDAFAALPPAEQTLPHAIDLLWSIFDGPAYPAALELVVASRTDDHLAVVVQAVVTRFEQTVDRPVRTAVPRARRRPRGRAPRGLRLRRPAGRRHLGLRRLRASG